MALDEDVARLAKGKNLATVVTLMPDGQPQAQLTWIDHDGENVLVNTEPQRQRSRNVRRYRSASPSASVGADFRTTVLIVNVPRGSRGGRRRGGERPMIVHKFSTAR